MLYSSLLKRKSDTHKGNYGHVFVLAGSVGLTGAPYMAAQAALLSGSGLVTVGLPKSLMPIIAKRFVEVMTRSLAQTRAQSISLRAFHEIESFSKKATILAIGPGLSQNKETQLLIRKVISRIDKPMVIDADGLNALAGHLEILRRVKHEGRKPILTPHDGEMGRLIGKSAKFVHKNRKMIANDFAKKYNVTLVLKGYHTIVSSPGKKTYINKTGNPGMASGGIGDCLTGIIASFMGQGLSAFDAARFGVYCHGLAGDLAAKEKGELSLTASDLLNKLPLAIKRSLHHSF
ncbi:MAG: NAD(P)H-hydrate dehydratase [Candidatus Omnitrophica bacterium]|nr:NAD(P)H-hydrate dehydratase [Candidatus Omnitrophota bacterium]